MSLLFTTSQGLTIVAGIVGFTIIFLALFAFASAMLRKATHKATAEKRRGQFTGRARQ